MRNGFKVFLVIIMTLIICAGGMFTIRRKSNVQQLPADIVRDINTFTPYFYKTDPPGDFMIDTKSVNYSQGVLLFAMKNNKNQSISITQQPVPSSLKNNTIQGAEQIDGVPGSAGLSRIGNRSTITMIAKNPPAFIIINTTDTISSDTLKDLARFLSPIKN